MHPLIEKILKYDAYVRSDIPKSLSATTLLSSVQHVILSRRHESSMDIKLNAASGLGTALHEYWDRIIPTGFKFEYEGDTYELIYQELSMNTPIGKSGFTLTGTSDLIFLKNNELIHIADFKSCKDYALKKRDFTKWSQQLSIYGLLTHLTLGKPVDDQGTIFYFNKSAEATSKFPFGVLVLDLMSLKDTRDFIMERTLEFKKYWDVPDHELPACNPLETWNGRFCSTYCGFSHVCEQINCFCKENYNF